MTLRNEIRTLRAALGYYTCLPWPGVRDGDEGRLADSIRYLPIAGWLVGGISAGVFLFIEPLTSQSVAVALAMITSLLVTCGFHEDGLADVCDGFGGGWTGDQILKIMKDSRIGAYGAAGLTIVLILKFSLLTSLPAPMVPVAIICAHSMSRLGPVYIVQVFSYAGAVESSRAMPAIERPSRVSLLVATVAAVLPLLLLTPKILIFSVFPLFLMVWILSRYFYRRIRGYTGDCLGATQQIGEITFLLFLLVIWNMI